MKTKHTITRRGFIEKSALGSLVLSTVLVGSSTDNRIIEPNDPHQAGSFDYGVASFDPTDNRVIIWTFVTTGTNTPKVTLTYQIATNEAFTTILKTE